MDALSQQVHVVTAKSRGGEKERQTALLFIYLFIFFRGRGREGEKYQLAASCTCSLLGMEPDAQAWALTGNRTDDPSLPRDEPHPLSLWVRAARLYVTPGTGTTVPALSRAS